MNYKADNAFSIEFSDYDPTIVLKPSLRSIRSTI